MDTLVKLRPLVRQARETIDALRFGRPDLPLSVAEYAKRNPQFWHPVSPASPVTLETPRCAGSQTAVFEALQPIPELGLLSVPNGIIVGPHGWVFTDSGAFLTDCSWPERVSQPRTLPRTFRKGRHLRGVCLSIASDWGTYNYGHFLFESLGRFSLFEKSGIDLESIDHIYCPAPDSALTRELIERLGIPIDKCVWAQDEPQVSADMVLATTFPGTRYDYPPMALEFLSRARGKSGQGPKRLYVPRGNVRALSNASEIIEILRGFDFEIYDFTKQAGQDAFADAEIVVGPHGAGLSNIVFCKPGAEFLEIMPSDQTNPFYQVKAMLAGVHASYILGQSETVRGAEARGPSPYNFSVNPDEVRSAIQRLVT